MKKVVIFSYFVIFMQFRLTTSSDCNKPRKGNLMINNGIAAVIGEFPFSAVLMYTDFTTRCSGALITKTHVLTAAHCPEVRNITIHDIMAGDVVKPDDPDRDLKTLQWKQFHKFIRHPKYIVNPKRSVYFVTNAQYDVGLVIVDHPFRLSYAVKLLPLPIEKIETGEICVLAGWGRKHWKLKNSTHHLMYKYDKIRAKSKCRVSKFNILCGGPRFGCGGDCGSVLVCRGKAYGVFNNAITVKRKLYMLYADVYNHREWIINNTLDTGGIFPISGEESDCDYNLWDLGLKLIPLLVFMKLALLTAYILATRNKK